MSVLNYSVAIWSLGCQDIFSIVPTGVEWLKEESMLSYRFPSLRSSLEPFCEGLFQSDLPELRVTKYKPEKENIILDLPVGIRSMITGHAFSKLLNNPDLILVNVSVDRAGFLNAVFKNKETGESVLSTSFSGELVVESRYNDTVSKTYKFYVSHEPSLFAVIAEIGSDFARSIEYYNDNGSMSNYLHISELRP